MRIRPVVGALAATSLLLVACGSPSAEDVAARTSEDTVSLLKQAMKTVDTSTQAASLDALFRGVTAAQGDASGVPQLDAEASTNEPLDKIKKHLAEQVFTEDQVESSAGDSVVFKLKGDKVCAFDGQAPAQECVDFFTKVAVRLRVTMVSNPDGLDLELMIAGGQPALTYKLRKEQSLAVAIDLGATKAAVEAVRAAGYQIEVDFPQVFQGSVETKLTRHGDLDFSLSQSVLTDITVEQTDSDGRTRRFTTGAISPMTEVRLSAPAKRFTFAANMGPTTYQAPYSDFAEVSSDADLSLSLAGLGFNIAVEEGAASLATGHLDLGQGSSAAKVGADEVLKLDLNAAAGRGFDFQVAQDAVEQLVVTIDPKLHLDLKLFFQPLAALGVDVARGTADETYSIDFSGGPVKVTLLEDGGLRMEHGTFAISSTAATTPTLQGEAGACLREDDVEDGDEGDEPLHPLSRWTTVCR